MFNPWGPAGVHPLPSPGPRSGRSEVLEGKGHRVRVRVGRWRGWRPRGGGRRRWGCGGSPSPALAPQPPAHPTCPHPWALWLSAPAHPGPSRGAGPAALTLTPSLSAVPLSQSCSGGPFPLGRCHTLAPSRPPAAPHLPACLPCPVLPAGWPGYPLLLLWEALTDCSGLGGGFLAVSSSLAGRLQPGPVLGLQA